MTGLVASDRMTSENARAIGPTGGSRRRHASWDRTGRSVADRISIWKWTDTVNQNGIGRRTAKTGLMEQ